MVKVWICSGCNSTIHSRYKIYREMQKRTAEKSIGGIRYLDLNMQKILHLNICCAQEIISYQDMVPEIYGMDILD